MKFFYFDRLSEKEQTYYGKIVAGLDNRSESIAIYGLKDEKILMKCVEAVKYDLPKYFYVEFSLLSMRAHSDYIEFLPNYIYNDRELEDKKRKIEEQVNIILNAIPKDRNTSIYDKCLWLHNCIVRNCVYDDNAIKDGADVKKAYTIEGVFLDKTAVCQGISMAYRYLCQRLGIDAIIVRGKSIHPGKKEYGHHAWNIIRNGDEAIHIDVTWDMCRTGKDNPICYDYFFMPDIEMMRDHQYVKYPVCRNRTLSMFSRANAYFSTIDELKSYVDANEVRIHKQEFFLYFKMRNRKESKKEIADILSDYIMSKVNRNFSYTYSVNETQSVFLFKFKYKQT